MGATETGIERAAASTDSHDNDKMAHGERETEEEVIVLTIFLLSEC